MNPNEFYQRARGSLERETEAVQPESLEHAYSIQKDIAESLGKVGGWKLGGTTNHTRKIFNTQATYYGAIDQLGIKPAGDELILPSNILNPAGEAEICFEFSTEVTRLRDYELRSASMDAFISSVMPSIELPWSVFELPESGLNVLIADSCASGALITGEPHAWESNLAGLLKGSVSLIADGESIASGSVETIVDGPIEALRDFLILAREHDLQLEAGQLVATGGCTPCVKLPADQALTVSFEALGSFSFSLRMQAASDA